MGVVTLLVLVGLVFLLLAAVGGVGGLVLALSSIALHQAAGRRGADVDRSDARRAMTAVLLSLPLVALGMVLLLLS